MQAQMSKMKKSDLPTDLGLLPDTLIKPPSKDLPSIFSDQWKKRLRIEWKSLTQGIMDTFRHALPFDTPHILPNQACV